MKRTALIISVFLNILAITGCIASTQGLTEEQQKIAVQKYPPSPGLNIVEDDVFLVPAKIFIRILIFPVTFGTSENILRLKREYPYRMFVKEIERKEADRKKQEWKIAVYQAIEKAAKKCNDYYTISSIALVGMRLNGINKELFHEKIHEKKLKANDPKYWEYLYDTGLYMMDKCLDGVQDKDNIIYGQSEYSNRCRKQILKTLEYIKTVNENSYLCSSITNWNSPASTSTALEAGKKLGHLDIQENAYGLGVHSDQFGRPVKYEVIGQPKANTDLLKVKPNAYGLGVGMDQFGRPVKAKTAW